MTASTKLLALVPAARQTGQRLVLLSLFALLVLSGAGVSRAHSAQMVASNGEIIIGETLAVPTGVRIAATNGDIHISALAAEGDIHIGA